LAEHQQKLDQAALTGAVAAEEDGDRRKPDVGGIRPILKVPDAQLREH
jgi:hypothetical protein